MRALSPAFDAARDVPREGSLTAYLKNRKRSSRLVRHGICTQLQ